MAKYIDSEKLKHILNNSKYYGKKQGNDFADMITECEAEDVAPIKHGHWIPEHFKYETVYTCSACNEKFIATDEEHMYEYRFNWNYCANCGAKMEGEK